jgi:TPR repeat protein
MMLLSTMYEQGLGIEENQHVAFDWLMLAATKMLTPAQIKLALRYKNGDDIVPLDLGKAAFWMSRAAKVKDPEAQYQLGLMYLEGIGLEKNDEQAFKYISWSAAQNHAKAQQKLGDMYEQGIGTNPNAEEAAAWHEKAAAQAQADALEKLKV